MFLFLKNLCYTTIKHTHTHGVLYIGLKVLRAILFVSIAKACFEQQLHIRHITKKKKTFQHHPKNGKAANKKKSVHLN